MVFPYLPTYTSQHINLLHHTNELNVAQRILSNVLVDLLMYALVYLQSKKPQCWSLCSWEQFFISFFKVVFFQLVLLQVNNQKWNKKPKKNFNN